VPMLEANLLDLTDEGLNHLKKEGIIIGERVDQNVLFNLT